MKSNLTKTRKLRILFLTFMVLSGFKSFGQHLELTAFGGGTFAANLNNYATYYSKAQIQGSAHYGGSLDYFLARDGAIDLTFIDQPTTGTVYGIGNTPNAHDGMHVTYILLGGNKYYGDGKMKIYGGFGLGVGILSLDHYSSTTDFAIDLHGGVKFDLSDNIGLRFQIQLDSPIDGGSYGIGIAPGGAVVGLSSYYSIVQFGGNIGLVFKFGGKK